MLLNSKVHDIPAPPFLVKPFQTIPLSMQSDFTYDGKIEVKPWYFENSFPTNRTSGKILCFCHGYRYTQTLNWKMPDYNSIVRLIFKSKTDTFQG